MPWHKKAADLKVDAADGQVRITQIDPKTAAVAVILVRPEDAPDFCQAVMEDACQLDKRLKPDDFIRPSPTAGPIRPQAKGKTS